MNWVLLKNSLWVSSLSTLLAAGFGLTTALCLAGLPRPWRTFGLGISVLALALPPFLVTNCWLDLLGAAGVWRSWAHLTIFSLGGTAWILGLLLWPITLLAIWSAWQRLEPAHLETDPAVTGSRLLTGLLLPISRSALAQALVLTFVLALNNFAVPAILQVKVFPAEIWVRFNTTFDTMGALTLSWPLVLGPALLLLWFARRGLPWPHLETPVPPRLFRQQLTRPWVVACTSGTLLISLLSVALPLFQLFTSTRTWTELPGAFAAGHNAAWNSFRLAAGSATLIIALSLVFATRSQSWSPVGKATGRSLSSHANRLFGWMLWLPFLVPGVLLGVMLIVIFNRPWLSLFYQSAGIAMLAFVLRYLALGWNTVAHATQMVDPNLIDVARLEGATRWQLLRFVQWPQLAPQVAAVWYITFVLCLWDVESMLLVVPPGGETLALRIFNLLHYGHNAQVNALCLLLLGLACGPLLAWRAWSALSATVSSAAVRSRFKSAPAKALMGFSACLLLLLCGCGQHQAASEVLAHSQLFERVEVIGSRGVGVGQLNKPRSVAVDRQDNLYVVDMTGRVQKFSSNGVFLLSWQMPQTDLGRPKGMCRDRDGNIVVVEPHYQRINHYTPDGKLVVQWGEKGTNAGQFSMPRAVSMDSQQEMFVSEYGAVERVQKFACAKADGQSLGHPRFVNSFGRPGTGPGEFNRPEGLFVDAHDRLYIADSCNHRIQVFSKDGQFLRTHGKAGTGKGELGYPYDICVDAAGRQYVCEFGNSRIQVFDANDQPLEIIGEPGAEPGQFSNPWGVALDSAGNLYVADSQNHRVQKLVRKKSGAT